MCDHSTADQVEQQYVQSMGTKLGRLFYGLWNECAWLHWKWGEYVTLFGTKPERIDLLNAAAGSFFRIVQDSLREDIFLHIARLTDPPESVGRKNRKKREKRENLSLQRLPPMVDRTIRCRVEKLLQTCLTKSEFARAWRNRRIAHRDLHLALNDTAIPLPPASRQDVREAIDSIAECLNAVELHYLRRRVAYAQFISPLGNAEALLYVIRDGLEAKGRRQQRLASGDLEPEDSNPAPAV